MKTAKIVLSNIKQCDAWADVCHQLGLCKIKDEEGDFTGEEIYNIFEYGEYGNLEIIIDENLNIIGGKIIPFK